MRRRSIVALLVYLPTNAVLFGLGAVVMLGVPALNARADLAFQIVIAASFILAAPIGWLIAPRPQARAFRRREDAPGRNAARGGAGGGAGGG